MNAPTVRRRSRSGNRNCQIGSSSKARAVIAASASMSAMVALRTRNHGVTISTRRYPSCMTTVDVATQGALVKAAAREVALASTDTKNAALLAAADVLLARSDEILAANAADVAQAEADGTQRDRDRPPAPHRRRASSRWPTGCDRLRGCPTRWARCSTAGCVRTACASSACRVPLGVVAIIYENRPNVTCDAAALCLKSGNAAFLRGSSARDHLEPRHRRRAARRRDQGRSARRRRHARRRRVARGGGGVHAAARCHRLPDPARRAVADRVDPRERDSAVRDRRRRQLPRVRRRVGRSRRWPRRSW